MMASMAQSFNPGIAGMAPGGQPMAHHPSNQGMPGGAQPVTMGQPMHPGMAGPGMPQVSQAGPMMMMQGGGPPGGVPAGHPNAHAMQHLNPNGNHMFPGQQMGMNPQHVEAQRRHQAMAQQQQRQVQQQQQQLLQQQQNGVMTGMPPGQHPFQGNPALGGVNLPPHLQQQQQAVRMHEHAQRLQRRQQHIAQMQAQAQAHQQQNAQQTTQQQQQQQQGQQPQPNPQQRQQQAMAVQQAALQQAVTQAATSQGQPASQLQAPTPQIQQGGSDFQPPAAAREQAQQQQAAQQQPQQAQQTQQQLNQPGNQSQIQNTSQNQHTQQSQQQGNPQNVQQQQQGQQGQQSQLGQPHNQQQLQNQHQLTQQQQAQMMNMNQRQAAVMMQNRMQQQARLHCGSLLLMFGDVLSQAGEKNRGKDLNYWQGVVQKFFSEEAVHRITYWSHREEEDKQWEIQYPSLARFYCKHFTGGVKHIQLQFEHPQQRVLPDGIRQLECHKASLVMYFENRQQVVSTGRLQAEFNAEDQFNYLDIAFSDWTEYIPRLQLKNNEIKLPDLKHSPSMSKNQGKRAQQQQQKQEAAANRTQRPTAPIPKSVVDEWGIPRAVQEYLEIFDTMSQLTDVFSVTHARGGYIPAKEALQICCNNPQPPNQQFLQPNQQQQFHTNLPPHVQGQQPTQFGGAGLPNNFLSPVQQNHPNLPGTQTASPATLSNHNTPAMQNMHLQHQAGQSVQGSMAAPSGVAMSHQASHQGTNPSAAGTPSAAMGSANASPNVGVTGKRRRPSGIDDGDGNGPIANGIGPAGGAKVKQSPKVSGKKGRPNG